MCSPDTKVLLTSLTSFPRLSLKTSTVSDRSHKEELKESCLYKREKRKLQVTERHKQKNITLVNILVKKAE